MRRPVVLALAAFLGLAGVAPAVSLVEDGKPKATIIVPDKPTVSVEYALKELNETIQAMTGTKLPVAKPGEPVKGAALLLGPSAALEKYGVRPDGLRNDDWLIRSGKDFLAIVGRDEDDARRNIYTSCIGTWNGTIAFFEDHCGVRHYMPGKLGVVVPKRPTLEVPDALDVAGHKSVDWGVTRFGGSALEMRWLWRGAPGVKVRTCGGHSWEPAIPVKQYFKEHPEYFALVAGRRSNHEQSSLCVTNPDVLRLKIEWAKEQLKESDVLEVGHPDSYGGSCPACECEKCVALGAGDRLGDRVYWFHRQAADAIRQWDPAKKLLLTAYGPTKYARPDWKFPDNVVIEVSDLGSFEKAPEGFVPWGRAHNQFSVYVYFWLAFYKDGYAPHSSQKRIREAFALFRKYGVSMIYYCSVSPNWGLEAPQYYLDYRLRMDLNADVEKALTEFYAQFYGPAAAPMRAFFDVIEEAQATAAPGANTSENIYLTRWPATRTARALARLDDAAKAAGDDGTIRQRIELSRPAMQYLSLTTAVFEADRSYRRARTTADLETVAQAVKRRAAFVDELVQKQESGFYRALGLPDPFYPWLSKPPLREQLTYGRGTGLQGPFDVDFASMLDFIRRHGTINAVAVRGLAPTVDGALDDPVWRLAPKLTGFENAKGGGTDVPAEFQVAYDDHGIYAAFTLHEPAMAKMEAKPYLARTQGKAYYEDCVELFLGDGTEASRKYCHFVLSFTGARYSGRSGFVEDENDPLYCAEDTRWKGEWQAAVRLDPDRRRWTAEIAVPWSSLGFAAPNPGSTLSANFCRNRWTERRDPKGWADLVSWSPTFAGLTDSTRFGRLELGN